TMLLLLSSFGLFSACQPSEPASDPDPETNAITNAMSQFPDFDLQGHRGARGLMPENTIPSFLKALEYPITTMEFDVVVSADSQLVVSHEPWFHHDISTAPDGSPVTQQQARELNMFEMSYEEIASYDVGRRGHPGFPEQEPVPAVKPLMSEAIEAIEAQVADMDRAPVMYNIETKSTPEWSGRYVPGPETFAQLLYDELRALGVLERVFIQSFDVRTLQAMREIDQNVPLVLLIENERSVADNIAGLGFTPDVYSPYFIRIDEAMVEELHNQDIKLVPWTINEKEDMHRLIEMGVDGLITDYPNRAAEVL
ncbi:MAG: glycerophosphodiester phosphodiesterase family protein, partial [Cyclonatronaceae bacterium]